MAAKTGSLSINSENIFPIIKKWLYSDHDIFYRELVSNGCDAITKLKKLELMGEYTKPEDVEYKILVQVDSNAKTITFTDNGLGMTADEVEEYINQIAFSGAQDFLEKYKDKANEDQIIGHFGLGFYSAFMVADKVTIDTLSYRDGEKPVHWKSEGGTEFSMDEGDRSECGTSITLYLNEDSVEFANEYRAREVIEKYCAFMPVPIFLENTAAEPQYETIEKDELTDKDTIVETIVEEAKTEEKENENGEKEIVEVSPAREKYKILKRPVALNETHPLWNKHPNECTEEEYKAFYRKVFMDFKEPLFWIHLNMDYPFNLKGILYFPKINMEYESIEGTIKLYNNQVFIADNIKEVIPEFLMLLKGVIDCPDLPLNVSRSALQNDGFVKKISDYITKKVADKLTELFTSQRETYQGYWNDIAPFIKYGCMKDQKFFDSVKKVLLLKTTDGSYLTFEEYKTRNEAKAPKKVFYTNDPKRQAASVAMYTQRGIDVAVMDSLIDVNFMSFMEYSGGEDSVTFARVDADVSGLTEDSDEGKDLNAEDLEKLFRKALGKEDLAVKLESLANPDMIAMVTEDEQSRRFKEMSRLYGEKFPMPDRFTLVLNRRNSTVRTLATREEGEVTDLLCKQIYDLARMSAQPLESEEITEFIARSQKLVSMVADEK